MCFFYKQELLLGFVNIWLEKQKKQFIQELVRRVYKCLHDPANRTLYISPLQTISKLYSLKIIYKANISLENKKPSNSLCIKR